MELGPELAVILDQLHATRASAEERQKNLEKSIREEARRLKDESSGDGIVDRDVDSGWGQRQLLDLDSIAFEQGGRLVVAKKIELPALKPKAFDPNEKLIKIADMPDWAQPAFKGMKELNRVQSKVYETALFKADNILLCAPTGAGKTNVAVLTILQQIALNRYSDGSFNHNDYKIIYVAPMKALVAEVVGNLAL